MNPYYAYSNKLTVASQQKTITVPKIYNIPADVRAEYARRGVRLVHGR